MTRDKDQKSGKKPPRSRPSRGKVLEAVDKAHEGERIAKVMARAGLCSRRDAEDWIAAGRVAVNGKVLESAALNVTEDDTVLVDGKPLATRERTRLFLFHKPRGLVTTDRDPEGRATVFDYIADNNPDLPRLMSVGRLDINTEGLLLLTNDGGLARVLELPSTGWLRRYRARANGATDQARLDTLKDGVTIDGIDYAGVEAKLDRVQGANVWITLGLREGQEPRGQAAARIFGAGGQPAHSRLLWPVPARRIAGGDGRGGQDARARRPAGRKAGAGGGRRFRRAGDRPHARAGARGRAQGARRRARPKKSGRIARRRRSGVPGQKSPVRESMFRLCATSASRRRRGRAAASRPAPPPTAMAAPSRWSG